MLIHACSMLFVWISEMCQINSRGEDNLCLYVAGETGLEFASEDFLYKQ